MKTTCTICPRACAIEEDDTGFCRARKNENGQIIDANYGRLTALALDPIEKKPLARFMPGKMILSAGSFGCNLRCSFCQNSDISMNDGSIAKETVLPQALADKAEKLIPQGNIGVAYTYNEPVVGFEYVRDCGEIVHNRGMVNVLVTNGYINEAPLIELLRHTDAMNIDLKAFTERFYRMMGGHLDVVKRSIALAAQYCHVEVTTLIVPGENDSPAEMDQEAKWLASIDRTIPLHISRFFPRYKMTNAEATDPDMLFQLADVARYHLDYVYTGNV